jgi:hypothetical protein
MPLLTNVKVVYYPSNARSILHPLDLGITKFLKHLYRKHPVQNLVCLMDLEQDTETEVSAMQAIHYIAAAW